MISRNTSTGGRRPIAPVNTREELIYLLSRASELEHDLACIYLFAGYSLKSRPSEGGLTQDDAVMVSRWKRKLASVAVEEMLHLAQVSNMLTAIGGAPHFRRSNFPLPASTYPFGIELSLEPFSQRLIERFVCYEMPETGVLTPERQAVYDAIRLRSAAPTTDLADSALPTASIEPFDIDFNTVGEFYHKVESGFTTIPEEQLFIGPREAQSKAQYLDLEGELIAVVDAASAVAGIEMIVEQGEAPTKDHPDAHFAVFDSIRIEFEEATANARAGGRVFEPVRPIISNPMTRYYGNARGNLIGDPLTHEVADLFNMTYDTMLLMLLRFFAHTDENEEELRMLARGTLRLMASALRPLGEALAQMPAGPAYPGKSAGPGFGYNRNVHLLVHKRSSWIYFLERLWNLSDRATRLASGPNMPQEISEAAAALESVAEHLMPYSTLVAGDRAKLSAIRQDAGTTIRPERNGPYVVSNLHKMTNSLGETLATRAVVALCRCGGSAIKPYCDGTHARIGFDSAKLRDRTADNQAEYEGKEITVLDNRGTCCHFGNCTDHLASVFRHDAEPFVDPNGAGKDAIIEIVRQCPSGALSYKLAGVEYRGEDREQAVYVSKNGPYYVQGGIELEDSVRNEGALLEHFALCRCGKSKNKPFCDGSHWYAKFTDDDN